MIKAIIPSGDLLEIPTSQPTQPALTQQIVRPSMFASPLVLKLNLLEKQLFDILNQKTLPPDLKMQIYQNLLTTLIELNKFRKKTQGVPSNQNNQSTQTDQLLPAFGGTDLIDFETEETKPHLLDSDNQLIPPNYLEVGSPTPKKKKSKVPTVLQKYLKNEKPPESPREHQTRTWSQSHDKVYDKALKEFVPN